jgi:hypothetical protein
MNSSIDTDFANLLVQNFAGVCLFLVLGVLAGTAFPLALLAKRTLERSGHFLTVSERGRRRVFFACLLAACAAVPWVVLWVGRWHDGEQIDMAHAAVLIVSSAATMAHLLRRWRLRGD